MNYFIYMKYFLQGLFHQIMAMSGTICNVWAFTTRTTAQVTAFEFGRRLNNGTPIYKTETLIEVLNNASARDITIVTQNMTSVSFFNR